MQSTGIVFTPKSTVGQEHLAPFTFPIHSSIIIQAFNTVVPEVLGSSKRTKNKYVGMYLISNIDIDLTEMI